MPSRSEGSVDGQEPARQEAAGDDGGAEASLEAEAPAGRLLASCRNVTVESAAGASEIYVVNRAYALVAKGVGKLSMELEPGRYKVRQRIGHSEQVSDLNVLEGAPICDVKLPQLPFPSPFPLPGTSLLSDPPGPLPFAYGGGNLRFILRTPVEGGMALTPEQLKHMRAEGERLRLESFDGAVSLPFREARRSEDASGALAFGFTQPAGTYLVVQEQENGRQVCLPVVACAGRTTSVFGLMLSDAGEQVPVDLRHVAVAMLRDEALSGGYESSLLRMEAARKAIAAGHHMHGWTRDVSGAALQAGEPPENVLLDLMDAYLGWRCLNRKATGHGEPLADGEKPLLQVDRAALLALLKRAGAVLGWDNGDIAALARALEFDSTDLPVLPFSHPPLLKRSWDQLLSFEQANAQADKAMPFSYHVESGSTWFMWSEEQGARAAGVAEAARTSGRRSVGSGLEITLPWIHGGGVLAGISGSSISNPVRGLLAFGLKVVKDAIVERFPRLGRKEAPVVTFQEVEAMVAALLADKSFQEWLDKAQAMFAAEGKTIGDDSMRRLIEGLRSLSDPVLLETLGADAIAARVLAALRLPQSSVVRLVKDLLNGVAARLDGSDKADLLLVLRGVVSVAEAWLKLPSALPKKQ